VLNFAVPFARSHNTSGCKKNRKPAIFEIFIAIIFLILAVHDFDDVTQWQLRKSVLLRVLQRPRCPSLSHMSEWNEMFALR
jgi:hypothetical protein